MSIVSENQYRDLLSRPGRVARVLSDSEHLTHDQFVIRYAEFFRDTPEQADGEWGDERARDAAEELLDHAEAVKGWVDDHLSRWHASSSSRTGRAMRPACAKSPDSRSDAVAVVPTIVAVSLFFAERERRLRAGDGLDDHRQSVEFPYHCCQSVDMSAGVARALG